MLFSATDALALSEKIIAVAIFFETIELIQLRRTFADAGIWNWPLIKKEFEVFPVWFQRILGIFLEYRSFLVVLFARLGCAFFLFLSPHPLLILALLISTTLVCLRWRGTVHGGSDFMTLILLMALGVSGFAGRLAGGSDGSSPKIATACLWYIAIQACASYFIAGLVKLKNRNWRNGNALRGILSSSIYESNPMLAFLENKKAPALLASWAVITFECAFPLALLNPQTCLPLIIGAFSFHLANTYILGLNRFLFAWCAAYPALYYCSAANF